MVLGHSLVVINHQEPSNLTAIYSELTINEPFNSTIRLINHQTNMINHQMYIHTLTINQPSNIYIYICFNHQVIQLNHPRTPKASARWSPRTSAERRFRSRWRSASCSAAALCWSCGEPQRGLMLGMVITTGELTMMLMLSNSY